jgi:hypothetical protein
MLKIDYIKRKNAKLFTNFNDIKNLKITNLKNYIPLYNRFFSLNNNNFDSINLNHKWHLNEVFESESESKSVNIDDDKIDSSSEFTSDEGLINIYNCSLKNSINNNKKYKDVFFKIAPLFYPTKYLTGMCDCNNEDILNLPSVTNTNISCSDIYNKMNNENNSSYIDGFFTYLSSSLNQKYNIVNSINFYGAFNGIKNDYKINIFDDIDLLEDSDYFLENYGNLYNVNNFEDFFQQTNPRLKPIKIENSITLSSIKSFDDNMIDKVFKKTEDETESSSDLEFIDLNDLKSMSMDISELKYESSKSESVLSSNYSSSSNTSHTSDISDTSGNIIELNLSNNSNEDGEIKSSSESNESYETFDEEIIATIPKFPVHVICMEACESTYNDLIMEDNMCVEEWYASLMQIIMTLIVYQKAFNFTHNDLHVNNIMFNKTEAKYVYYIYNKFTYKVPTFGKIYKIIDFGRSIYKFDKKIFCSDSFEKDGDAYGQYNCEPYLNLKKARIDPNMSFDLCRLGCSIFDCVVDNIKDVTKFANETDIKSMNYVRKIIIEWCLDDNGVNMLYKSNGQDRYPEFKIYKMISRCVHNHTPEAQLERDCFKKYIYNGKIKSKDMLTDIDNIPSMF